MLQTRTMMSEHEAERLGAVRWLLNRLCGDELWGIVSLPPAKILNRLCGDERGLSLICAPIALLNRLRGDERGRVVAGGSR